MKKAVKVALAAVIAGTSAQFIASHAYAAEIATCGPWDQYRTENPVAGVPRCETRLWFSGKIERGDYDRLHEFLGREGKNVLAIVLQKSPGGDVDEAIKIGRLIRRLKLITKIAVSVPPVDPVLEGSTVTDETATCASACVLMWMAGTRRAGNWRLVVHRPFFDPTYFAGLNAHQADQRYRELEKQVYEYLHEMDTPESLIRTMRQVPSTDGKVLDPDYVRRELNMIIPSYDEWLTAKCGRLYLQGHGDLLLKQAQGATLTAEERKFIDQQKSISDCRLKAMIEAQKQAWTAEFE